VVHLDGQELCEMSGVASSSDGESSVGSLLNGLSIQISNGLGTLQTQLTENMSELKGNISELKGNISELRDQVNTNNQQITELRGQMDTNHQQITELRGQMDTNHQQTSGQMHAQYQGLMGVARGIQDQADTLENLIHRKARKTKAQLEQIQSTLKTVDRKQGVVQQATMRHFAPVWDTSQGSV
jgi:chromosome segregation ATPase